jgi:UDP-N-acetylmuramate dehydrogenase
MAVPSLQHDVPLAPRTTLQVGGAARRFAHASEADLVPLLDQARTLSLPAVVLGGGSNLLVADRGIEALVIELADGPRHVQADGEAVLVTAPAGASWDELVQWSTCLGFAGIECLSGIPGKVGAAPMQNIGAYGQEVAESLVSVRAVSVDSGARRTFLAAECGLGYRTSRFKHADAGAWIVTAVTLRLLRGAPPSLRYAELARRAADELGPTPSLAQVRDLVLAIRASKSMVLDPTDPNARSAGSFFTNPVVPPAVAADVRAAAAARGGAGPVPSWDTPHGVKLAAGWLIEQAGFARGWGVGPAGLSERHALAIVNRGGATAADIIRVAATVRRGVRDAFGVTLVPEPVFAGFPAGPDPTLVLDAAEVEGLR